MQKMICTLKKGVVLVLLLLYACTIGTAETNTVSTIDVTGTGTIQVEADQAEISLAVITRGTNIEEIQRENAEKMARIITALKSDIGLFDKEISTSYYSVYEEQNPSDRTKETSEAAQNYRVSNTISVTTGNVEKAGAIIDVAVANGANSVDSLQFSLTADTRRQYREEALQIAVEKATADAKIVSNALGMKLGKPTNVQIGGGYIAPYMMNRNEFASMTTYDIAVEDGGSTPIQTKGVEVSASVSISYSIE
ncbi:MAG: SIMPL domain-containing protein [Methanomicrobiales archaeon]|jgi:uncharacterized protein YggE|nr:SIMPL domain-containing protein [Methanomicrobiales archaeon]